MKSSYRIRHSSRLSTVTRSEAETAKPLRYKYRLKAPSATELIQRSIQLPTRLPQPDFILPTRIVMDMLQCCPSYIDTARGATGQSAAVSKVS
ncbi:hypothetical protein AFLA_000335 [Aspergillus flavus NRRL3357]|nr:hypothetical protein AFLA_000335 [Aspergillus flavus NRRL3357]